VSDVPSNARQLASTISYTRDKAGKRTAHACRRTSIT
jgi:hypothetical protein